MLDKARLNPKEAYGGSVQRIRDQIFGEVGSNVEPIDVIEALRILEPFAASDSDFSPLTGGFWTVSYDNFRYYFIETKPEDEDDLLGYSELSEQTKHYPILQAYARRGQAYVEDAAAYLRSLSNEQWNTLRAADGTETVGVPASDRLVTLSDNQSRDIDHAATELITAVERENSISGDGALRLVVIGQLKAGRELVRAQVFKAYLLHQTLVTTLGTLIERYKGQAIAETAKKLLSLLIEHIFGK